MRAKHGSACRIRHHAEIDMLAQDGGGKLGAALEWNCRNVQFEMLPQRFHAHSGNGADSGGGIGQLAGIGFYKVDKFVKCLPRRVRMDCEYADVDGVIAQ